MEKNKTKQFDSLFPMVAWYGGGEKKKDVVCWSISTFILWRFLLFCHCRKCTCISEGTSDACVWTIRPHYRSNKTVIFQRMLNICLHYQSAELWLVWYSCMFSRFNSYLCFIQAYSFSLSFLYVITVWPLIIRLPQYFTYIVPSLGFILNQIPFLFGLYEDWVNVMICGEGIIH